jgi:autotransporter-associated beta strand protein
MASAINRRGLFGISISSGTVRRIAWAAGLSAFAALVLAMPGPAQAAIYYDWTGATSGDISVLGNYTGYTTALPTDDLEFYQVAAAPTRAPTTNGSATLAVGGLIFGNGWDPLSTISIGGSAITLGGDGITDSNLEAVNLSLPITLGASQTWTNNSATGAMTISGAITGSTTSAATLTLSGSNTGANTISNAIADGTGGATSLVKTGAGTWILSSDASTFTGGVWIKQGTLNVSNNIRIPAATSSGLGIGTSAIQLGDTAAGTSNAVLQIHGVSGNRYLERALLVNAGNSGTKTLLFTDGGNNGATWSGAVTMNDTLNVLLESSTAPNYGSALTISGQISGGGDLIVNSGTGTSTGALLISNAANNYTGKTSILGGEVLFPTGTIGSATSSPTGGFLGAPSGSNATIVLGDTSGSANVVLSTPWDGNPIVDATRPILVQSGSSGTVTITSVNGNGGRWVINSNITLEKDLTLAPYAGNYTLADGTSTYLINGQILAGPSSSGDLIQNCPTGPRVTTYANANAPQNINTRINGGVIRWQPGGTAGIAVTNGTTTAFGTGGIYVNGGNFEYYVTDTNASGTDAISLSNPIHATGTAGGVYGWEDNSGGIAAITFSGPIDLDGSFGFGSTSTGGGGSAMNYTGTVTINQQAAGLRAITYNVASTTATLTGNIVDGAGTFANPLVLRNSNAQFNMLGTGNTYAGGTAVEPDTNLVNVVASSSLGAGNAVVLPGASLRLNAAANVASGKTVLVDGAAGALGVLSLGGDFAPSMVDSGSGGVLALDAATYATNLNLSSIGNGLMRLGAVGGSGVYGGSTLTPGGSTYRLGGGGGTLTVTNGVLAGAGNSLEVGTVGINGAGTVVLSAANTYGGTTTVNPGSSLQGAAQSSGGTPFGNGSTAVNLNGGSLILTGASSGTSTNIGAVTVNGWGMVGVTAGASGNTVLTAASLSLNATSSVFIVGSGVNGTTSQLTLTSTTGLPAINAANPTLPGNFVVSANTGASGQGDFAMYNDTGKTGFSAFTGYVASNATWSNITTAGTQVVNNIGANATLPAASSYSIYGLKMGSDNLAGDKTSTINVGAGGIIFNTVSTGYPNNQIQANVAFGSNEGFIYVAAGYNTWQTDGEGYLGRDPQITGTLTGSNGLTISGPGGFYAGNRLNAFGGITGSITVHQATLCLSGQQTPPDVDTSNYVFDGATLTMDNRFGMTLNGSLTLVNGGLSLYGCVDSSYIGPITLNGQITGAGPLSIIPTYTPVQINNTTNNYQGGTVIGAVKSGPGGIGSVQVATGSSLGTGGLVVTGATAVNLLGSGNLSTTAPVVLASGSTLNVENAGMTFASIEGGGNIVLGTGSGTSSLTVGDGTNRLYYGAISQASGSTGSLIKVGAGSLTMTGANTYTGGTSVNGGTLVVNSLPNSPVSVSPSAALGGAGSIGGNVTVNGGTLFGGPAAGTAGTLNIGGTLGFSGTSAVSGGTVAVAGATTITGPATLTVNGTLNTPGTLAVGSGVTLAGGGSIPGGVTLGGGQISPVGVLGGGAGLSVGSLTLNAGTLYINTGAVGASDNINVASTGSFNINGSIYVDLANNTQQGTFNLIDYSGSSTNVSSALLASDITYNSAGGGYNYAWTWSGGVLTLQVTEGASNTWNGGGTPSVNWSTDANWVGGHPTGGAITFGGTGVATNNNIPSLSASSLTFASGAGAFTLSGNNLTLTGDILNNSSALQTIYLNLALNPASQLTTIAATAGDITINGILSEAAAGTAVTVQGPGHIVTLDGANTYSGVTTIRNGATLSANNLAAAFGTGVPSSIGASTADAGNLVIDGGTLRYTGSAPTTPRGFTMTAAGATLDASGIGPIDFTYFYGGLAFSGAGPRTLTLTGSNTGLNTFGILLSDQTLSSVDYPTTLTKAGTGTWLVSIANGNNTFTGPVNLNLGVLDFDGLAALGAGTAINFNGGTLRWYNGATDDISVRTVSINGPSINGPGGATFDLQGGTVALAHPIGNGGSGSLTVLGGGTLALNATASYSGGTNINQATLQTGIANALPASGVVSLGAASTNGTLDLDGFSQTVGGLSSANAGTPASQIVGNSSTLNNATLTVAGSGPSTFNGTIKDALPGGSKTTALAVTSGTLNLGGANTLSGGVTVSGTGTLNANSASALGASTGTVNVSGSGALNLSTGITLANGNFTGGTVNTNGNNVAVTSQMQTAGYKFAYTPAAGAPSFSVTGANLANDSTARTITLSGGVLSVPTVTDPGQLAARWNSVNGGGTALLNTGNSSGIGPATFYAALAPSTAGVTVVNDPFGKADAVQFNGTSGYMDVANFNSALDFSATSFTASMWVKYNNVSNANGGPTASAYSRFWSDKQVWNSGPGWDIQRDNYSQKIGPQFVNGAGNDATYNWGTDPSDPNSSPWFLLTMAVNRGATTTATFYENGTQVGQTTGLTNITQSALDFWIGAGPDNGPPTPGDLWAGKVSDIRLYNAALSTAQVQSIYNSGAGDAGGAVTLPNTNISLTASSTLSLGTPTLGNLTLTNPGTSLAISGATTATFGNITATNVGSAPGGAISGISALTVSGNSINVTNSTDVLTLPATTFTASPVTLNASGAGKLVLGNAVTFSPAGGTLNVSAGTLQFTPAAAASSINGSLNVASGAVLSPMAGTLSVTNGGTLTLNPGSIYRWTYTDDNDYSSLNATAGSLVLPPSATPPVLQLSFSTAPTPSVAHPYILASWTTAPTNEPTNWTINTSLLPAGTTATWTDGTSGSFSTPGNWSSISYSGATLLYTATALELTGLTPGPGSAPLSSITSANSLTIGSSSTGGNVIVSGGVSTLPTITGLTIGDPTKSATAALNLASGGNLTATTSLSINSNGTLTTNGANVTTGTLGSDGALNVTGSSTVTAANLNVFGGTTTFGASSTAAVTTATVSLAGQLAMSGGGTVGTLNVTGAGASGVAIGGSTAVGAAALSGGTTTISDSQSLTTVSVSSPAVVNFNGPTTNVTDAVTGLTVAGGSVTFATGTAGTIALMNVTGGAVSIANQSVTTANLSGGTTTIPLLSTGTLGSTALNLNAAANLTANAGTVGPITFGSTVPNIYTGTTTLNSGATVPANITVPAGVTGTVNLNNPQTLLTVNGGNVTQAGITTTVAQSGGTLTFANNVTTANVTGGTIGNTAGTISSLSVPNGAGAVTVGASGLTVAAATLNGGTVNATNPVRVTSSLSTDAGNFNWVPAVSGTPFTASGANLASISGGGGTASTITLTGGTLTVPAGSGSSIAAHFSDYAGNTPSPITGTDGVVANSNWTNISVNWFAGNASNLVNSKGLATTAAVTCVGPNGGGTYWWVNGPAAGVDNLLEGPWGGDGGGGGEAIPAVITGIPYASYKIIAYSNPPYAGEHSLWLDSNPGAASNLANTPVAGSLYYYQQDSNAFDLITSQAVGNPSTGNYVVWTGLSGSSQTIWDNGIGGATNEGISGFEVVDTTPTSLTAGNMAISVTASSTFSAAGTPTVGNVSVSNGSTLTLAGATSMTMGTVTLAAGTTLSASTTLGLTATGGIVVGPTTVGTGSGTLDVAPGAILTYNGVISDNSSTTPGAIGELIKTGAGELKLGGTGTYTGNTAVEDGLLVIDSSEAIPSGSTVATTPNAAIVLGDPSLPSDGTSLGGLVPGSGGGLAASPNVVPEPGTLALLAAACGFAMLWLRRKGFRDWGSGFEI